MDTWASRIRIEKYSNYQQTAEADFEQMEVIGQILKEMEKLGTPERGQTRSENTSAFRGLAH